MPNPHHFNKVQKVKNHSLIKTIKNSAKSSVHFLTIRKKLARFSLQNFTYIHCRHVLVDPAKKPLHLIKKTSKRDSKEFNVFIFRKRKARVAVIKSTLTQSIKSRFHCESGSENNNVSVALLVIF